MKKNIENYRAHIWGIVLLIFFIHGAKLFNGSIGIDTEDIIHLQDEFYDGWLDTGRQGLVFLKAILGLADYNPYFANLITVIGLSLAVISWLALFDYTLQKKSSPLSWIVGGALWISHPILAEQLYFSLQSVEICIGMMLMAFALFCVVRWYEGKKYAWLVASILSAMLPFAMYQVFVPMFIMGTVMILLLQSLRNLQEKVTFKSFVAGMIPYVVVFLLTFGFNMLITRLFFSSSDYLTSLVSWGHESIINILFAIGKHIVRVFTGYHSNYYNGAFGVLCVVVLVLLILRVKRQQNSGTNCMLNVLFLYLAVCITPFLLTVICGCEPVVRSQLVLPIVAGSLAYLSVYLLQGDEACIGIAWHKQNGVFIRVAFVICIGVIAVGVWTQTQVTMRLYYTDACRYEYDVALANDVIMRIEAEQSVNGMEDKLPVFFVGSKSFQGNNACLEGEIIGCSFFDYDTEVEPKYWWSTRRILGFMHILGKDYEQVGVERIEEALHESDNMPAWPAEGCVESCNGMIIVKLSDYE